MCIYICIYNSYYRYTYNSVCMCMSICIYIYIYIERQRERERERGTEIQRERERDTERQRESERKRQLTRQTGGLTWRVPIEPMTGGSDVLAGIPKPALSGATGQCRVLWTPRRVTSSPSSDPLDPVPA